LPERRGNTEVYIMTFRSSLKWQLVLLVGLAACFSSSFAQADASEAKPVMEMPSPRYDAGTHWEGEVVTHAFEVKNTGNSELTILSVKPG
jgi:hypothetical protein